MAIELKQAQEIIKAAVEEFKRRDNNWKWKYTVEKKGGHFAGVRLHWEYLQDEKCDYFKIKCIRDEETQEDFFTAYDNYGEDITEELEDNTSLKETLYSVFWYASSRY